MNLKDVRADHMPPLSERFRYQCRGAKLIARVIAKFTLFHGKRRTTTKATSRYSQRHPDIPTASLISMVFAAATVLAIPELLEEILSYLPNENVLVLQRVNSTFRDVIKQSSPLRIKLFMQLKRRSPSEIAAIRLENRLELNPLATRLLDPESRFSTTLAGHALSSRLRRSLYLSVSANDAFGGLRCDANTDSDYPSWRGMRACDPPCEFFVRYKDGGVYLPPMTLGELYDKLILWGDR